MEIKSKVQEEAIPLIKDNHFIAIQWATGMGKSKVAIEMTNELLKDNKDLQILIMVAETAHKENWESEIKKWKLGTDKYTIECYASFKKYRDTNWDLIIFDEAHHLDTDIRLKILNSITTKYGILLSATLENKFLDNLKYIFPNIYSTKITLRTAIKWGVLPEPKIIFIPLELDDTEYKETYIKTRGYHGRRKTIKCKYEDRWKYLNDRTKYPYLRLEISCTERQKYNLYTEKFFYWKNQFFKFHKEYMRNQWLSTGVERKRFLGETKTPKVKELLSLIKNKRYICFCASIKQAEYLGGNNAIHSERKDSLDIINNFNEGNIDSIFAVGMLQEGQNLNNIEMGIISQLDGQERAFIQKFGRSLRAKDPIQFIFYHKDTRDEEYINNIEHNIDENHAIVLKEFNELYQYEYLFK